MTLQEVLKCLDEIRVPKPWDHSHLEVFVGMLASAEGANSQRIRQRIQGQKIFARAQRAVDTLRKTIPLLEEAARTYEPRILPAPHWLHPEQFLESCAKLKGSMFDIKHKEKPKKPLDEAIIDLFYIYFAITGRAEVSRDGPAVRFIYAMLPHWCDETVRTKGATRASVVGTVERYRHARPTWKLERDWIVQVFDQNRLKSVDANLGWDKVDPPKSKIPRRRPMRREITGNHNGDT